MWKKWPTSIESEFPSELCTPKALEPMVTSRLLNLRFRSSAKRLYSRSKPWLRRFGQKFHGILVIFRVGKRTPIFVRFSTVGGENGSADTVRDPRGFAVKFYTEEGELFR